MELAQNPSRGTKHILMVLDAFFPFDLRVEKEGRALVDAGYRLTVVCYRNEGQSLEEIRDGIRIVRTPAVVGHAKKGITDILRSLSGQNFTLKSLIRRELANADAIHAHDLPVYATAYALAKGKGLPVILDMHENFPEGLLAWFQWRKKPLIRIKNELFFSYKAWLRKEKTALNSADRVIAVVEEMRDRMVKLHGTDASKVTIVGNTESERLTEDKKGGSVMIPRSKKIVYVGSIGPHRGVDTAIEAMPYILAEDAEVRLVVVGSGNADTLAHLQSMAEQKGVADAVRFTGQVPYDAALKHMEDALLNIIPHHSNGQNEATVPHKLFQILLSRAPLMVSSCAPLKRIVGDNDAGLVFEAGNAADFAVKAVWALSHEEELQKMTERGMQLVKTGGYKWENDAARLVKMYDNLFVQT